LDKGPVINYRGEGAGGNKKLDAKMLLPPLEDNTIILDPPPFVI
jgi:hypothetical protein